MMNDILDYYGRCFIRSFDHYGYEKILRVTLPIANSSQNLFFFICNILLTIIAVSFIITKCKK